MLLEVGWTESSGTSVFWVETLTISGTHSVRFTFEYVFNSVLGLTLRVLAPTEGLVPCVLLELSSVKRWNVSVISVEGCCFRREQLWMLFIMKREDAWSYLVMEWRRSLCCCWPRAVIRFQLYSWPPNQRPQRKMPWTLECDWNGQR